MSFSQRLKALLKERGVTWKEVSASLNIGKNQQKYWEDRDSAPNGKTLAKLCKYFGVTADYLLGTGDAKGAGTVGTGGQPLALTGREMRLILAYRGLDGDGRAMVDSAIESASTLKAQCH